MRLLVAVDHHFVRDHDGMVYLGPPMAIAGYSFWKVYLQVFDEILVLARVRQAAQRPPKAVPAGGERVFFFDLPDYLGPWEYLRSLIRLRGRVQQAVARCDAFILRVPGAIGQLAWQVLRQSGRSYGVEVTADPWDMYSPGAVPSIGRPVARNRWSILLREMCRQAPCVSYVTREALQRRYPPGSGTWSTYASDVDLKEGAVEPEGMELRIRRLREVAASGEGSRRWRIGFVGAFAQMYKAPDILMRAAAACARGLEFTLEFVGDGKYKAPMERLAHQLGLASRARFLGALPPGQAVQKFLDRMDLFVLPSRQEGLPRAMVEAMARGCPCIGSTVGGIPELLAPEDLVPPGDADALAAKIREVLSEPTRMERMARRNWERAKDFQPETLLQRRLEFCREVRRQAEQGHRSDPVLAARSFV